MKPDNSIRETVREDGLRIITKNITNDLKTSVSITARNGSADDPAGFNGLHHFFEHMAFKGTRYRPRKILKSNLERYTINFNASTYSVRTTYDFQCSFRRLYEAIEIFLDLYLNSTYLEEEIEVERGVINTEIKTKAESDNLNCYYGMMNLLWQHNPIKHRGTGIIQDINRIDQHMLLSHRNIIHEPSNTVIIAAGKIDHDSFVNHINQRYPVSKTYGAPKRFSIDDESCIEPANKILFLKAKSETMSEIYSGIKVDKNLFADLKSDTIISILIQMLGVGMDSILWEEIREKRGLVYSITMNQVGNPYTAKGIYAHAKAIKANTDKVHELICSTIFNCNLDKDHFLNTKEQFMDAWEISMDSSGTWRYLMEYCMLWNSGIEELSNYKPKLRNIIKDIKFDDVVNLYEQIFKPEKLATCIVSPDA